MKKKITISSAFIVCILLTGIVQAVVVDSPVFPVRGIPYEMTNGPIFYPPIDIRIDSLSVVSFDPNNLSLPAPGEGWQVDSFFDVFAELSIAGSPFTIDSFFDVTYSIEGGSSGQGTASWEIEILSMNLAVPGMPAIIRESPTLPSLGMHIVTDIGGGQFQIDSFFDVFTELSVDGGQTWIPASAPMHMPVTPEPTTIALLTIGSLVLVRRKK